MRDTEHEKARRAITDMGILAAPDIYFDPRYGKTCESIEGGKAEVFEYKSAHGHICHQFIRRKIDQKVGGKEYFDLITPYGYGGPLIVSCEGDKETLIKGFQEAFSNYCKENHVVSEFVRFHPMIGNASDFGSMYEVNFSRYTVATNLRDYEDPFQAEFSKSCRKSIRRSIQRGVTYEILEKPDSFDTFIPIYYETMARNHADSFYFFDREYFNRCLQCLRDNIVLVNALYEGAVISSEFFFVWGKYIHSHLSGTLNSFLYLSPDYVIMYGIMEWGKRKGYHFIHTGGGTSNDPENPLYLFKKKFARNTDFDFYIGRRVWNQDIYDMLCGMTGQNDTGFFPAYRSRQAFDPTDCR